jgi:hypothetical protein
VSGFSGNNIQEGVNYLGQAGVIGLGLVFGLALIGVVVCGATREVALPVVYLIPDAEANAPLIETVVVNLGGVIVKNDALLKDSFGGFGGLSG